MYLNDENIAKRTGGAIASYVLQVRPFLDREREQVRYQIKSKKVSFRHPNSKWDEVDERLELEEIDQKASWVRVVQNLKEISDEEFVDLVENLIKASEQIATNQLNGNEFGRPDGYSKPFNSRLSNSTFFNLLRFSENAENLSKLRRSKCWNSNFEFYDADLWKNDLSVLIARQFHSGHSSDEVWSNDDMHPKSIEKFLYLYTEKYDQAYGLDKLKTRKQSTVLSTREKGLEFEILCKEILDSNGWTCELTAASGDYGIDISANKGPLHLVFQCKNYSNPVGIDAVQQIMAGREKASAHAGAVVSNSGFTKAAENLAETTKIMLLDLVDLKRL